MCGCKQGTCPGGCPCGCNHFAARRFVLQRDEDVSGVSGTGVVAEGVEFTDGKVALRWVTGEHRSTVLWDSIESVEVIHGHDGRTQVVWLD